jgi:hypothetical protein
MTPDSAISVGLHSRDNTVEGTSSLRPGPHYQSQIRAVGPLTRPPTSLSLRRATLGR